MITCNICGATYTPPDTGDKMPLDAPGWDFVCWTPGKLETAVFTHRPWACRDVLKKRVVTLEAIDHLRNVIRLFERAGWAEHHKLDELREELTRR